MSKIRFLGENFQQKIFLFKFKISGISNQRGLKKLVLQFLHNCRILFKNLQKSQKSRKKTEKINIPLPFQKCHLLCYFSFVWHLWPLLFRRPPSKFLKSSTIFFSILQNFRSPYYFPLGFPVSNNCPWNRL